MTQEQWLVYIWSIYPNGGFKFFYIISLSVFVIFIAFILIGYSEALDRYKTETIWYKMGKWKVIVPSVLLSFIFLSNLVPSREHFAYIIATPYVVESGKSIVESLNDPSSKLYKLNSIMDKGLDKVLEELNKKEKSN